MDWAGRELKINSINDWKNINMQQIMELGGRNLANRYQWSIYQLLSTVYPENDWLSWKYHSLSASTLDSKEWKAFLEYAGKQLNVKEMQDWYKVKEEVKIKREKGVLTVSIATN